MKIYRFIQAGVLIVALTSLTQMCFASCPTPESITISADHQVTAPGGYTIDTSQLNDVGPIRYDGITLQTTNAPQASPPYTFNISEVVCEYAVGQPHHESNLGLWKLTSFTFTINDLSGKDGWQYISQGLLLNCVNLGSPACNF